MKHILFLTGLVLTLCGCSTIERKVPIGTYLQNGTSNFIRVSAEQAQVHIEGMDARDDNGHGLTFNYVLWSDGQLFLVVSRSVELLYGYPSIEYSLNDGKILAKDVKSGRHWEFSHQSQP
jgi:hypothetical protein